MRLALDNARKSFISNVSHELKTPLAIISGYAEGLCAGIGSSPETIKEYCGIINDESKRMNELVLELLELTRLESKSYSFSPDYCDLGEIIKSQAEHFSLQAEQNGITIENRVPLSLECFAQEDRIEIVIKNYLSNGCNHRFQHRGAYCPGGYARNLGQLLQSGQIPREEREPLRPRPFNSKKHYDKPPLRLHGGKHRRRRQIQF